MSNVRKASSSRATGGVVYDLAQARARHATSENGHLSTDSAGISDQARELARANSAVADSADVRSEKVRALKAAIENGSYSPDPREIARKIVEQGL